ncbi:MAG: hypothetical protein M0Z29_03055, partial [Actinomycetota bacterium]|nr:hypothetical protein [Actinomycetota bacterium]
RYPDVASALADARTFRDLPAIAPRMLMEDGELRVLLPGEEGFERASTAGLQTGAPLPGRPGGPAIS